MKSYRLAIADAPEKNRREYGYALEVARVTGSPRPPSLRSGTHPLFLPKPLIRLLSSGSGYPIRAAIALGGRYRFVAVLVLAGGHHAA